MCVCSWRHVYEEAMKIYLPSSLPFPIRIPPLIGAQRFKGGREVLFICSAVGPQPPRSCKKYREEKRGIVFGNAAA